MAIFKVIEYTLRNVDDNNITIYSDSLSTLAGIQNHDTTSDIARKIQNTHTMAQQLGKHITYTWIPGHCNVSGNEQPDKAAKLSHLPLFTYYDIKKVIDDDTLLPCQMEWKEMSTNIKVIKKFVQPFIFPIDISRKHDTSINRLRIGHTPLI